MNIKELRNCKFCQTTLTNNNRAKEHIIPKWLCTFLSINEVIIQPTHYSPEIDIKSTRTHRIGGLVEGNICCECNNGWMSQLEIEAMPILKPLILGNKEVIELEDSERYILARWATKTAYMLNSGSNYLKNIPDEHYLELKNKDNELPKGVSVYAQQHHETEKFYWMQSPSWEITNLIERMDYYVPVMKNESYKIGFQFGKLLLLIAYIPTTLSKVYPVLWLGIHIPLYPKRGKAGYYNKNDFNWNDTILALSQFHLGLKITEIED